MLKELYDLGAPIEERVDRADGVLVRARLPERELPRYAPYLIADAERSRRRGPRGVIELPDRPPAERRAAPRSTHTRETQASTSRPASHCSLAPGERAVVPTGLAVAIPEGFAGFVQPRSGLAARHGIAVVNSPGLIDSGYRGEIRVVLLNTDRDRLSSPRPATESPSSSSCPVPELEPVELDALPPSERGVRGFGSSQT